MIIGFSGKAYSGKDTAFELLRRHFEHYASPTRSVHRYAFADHLKEVAQKMFGFTRDQVYGELKDEVDARLSKALGKTVTPRWCLQAVGDGMRQAVDSNVWVAVVMAQIAEVEKAYLNKLSVITDVRYPNEAAAIKEAGGYVVRLERPNGPTNSNPDHKSETALDDYASFDAFVLNDSTRGQFGKRLIQTVESLMEGE